METRSDGTMSCRPCRKASICLRIEFVLHIRVHGGTVSRQPYYTPRHRQETPKRLPFSRPAFVNCLHHISVCQDKAQGQVTHILNCVTSWMYSILFSSVTGMLRPLGMRS
jgi:hypothetical protein